ncbi:uncharacterized protein LOC120330037 [Styela clava]
MKLLLWCSVFLALIYLSSTATIGERQKPAEEYSKTIRRKRGLFNDISNAVGGGFRKIYEGSKWVVKAMNKAYEHTPIGMLDKAVSNSNTALGRYWKATKNEATEFALHYAAAI